MKVPRPFNTTSSWRLPRQASLRRSPSGVLGLVCFGLLAAGAAFCAPEAPRPNIVVVVIDALRPDHLGCYGYERPTSPTIDQIAAQGIVFDQAITHAPWTKATFATMLTSLYTFQNGVENWETVMSDTLVTLAEVLGDHGYETICVANVLGVAGRFNVLQGFGHSSAVEQYTRSATESNAAAFEIIRGINRPFFLLIHYYDAHMPYSPPKGYVEMVGGSTEDAPQRFRRGPKTKIGKPDDDAVADQMLLYDACIRYVDDAVHEIVDFLAEQAVADQTVLILTADHGEAFWEHDVCSHGEQLYDEALRVPLILSYPAALDGHKRIDVPVGHIDLMPTVVDLAGVTDTGTREGASLLGLITEGREPRRGPALPQGALLCECTLTRAPDTKCIRTRSWKLIAEPLTGWVELFDIEHDPFETENLWSKNLAVGDSLMTALRRIPGISRGGWRLAFTGGDDAALVKAEVTCPKGARLTHVSVYAKGKSVSVELSPDSTSFAVETRPERVSLVHFGVTPTVVGVRIRVGTEDGKSPPNVVAGPAGTRPLGEAFVLRPDDVLGVSERFHLDRVQMASGAYVWWLPGEAMMPSKQTDLTPEEKKRLKALGYLQ